jgi:glycosyltransferase involved in cell wall biosynthesis
MSSNPTVSVVVTAYNAAPYIEEALGSIAVQGVESMEVIVTDDDSTDGTREIAAAFQGLDLEVVTGPNVGIGRNVVRGVQRCSGDYVALIAADDRWRPGHLEPALAALDNEPAASLAFSNAGRIDSNSQPLTAPPTLRSRQPRSGWIRPEEILYSNFIDVWGLVVRAAALRGIGGLDPELDLLEWDLLIRLVSWGPVIHIPRTTVDYRVHPGGASNSSELTLQGQLAIYRKHVADPAERRRLTARATMRAAYYELWPTPTPESVKRARNLLSTAFRTSRGIVSDRLFLPLLASAHAGSLYIAAVRVFGDRFRTARLKLWMQRALGMATRSSK